MRPLFARPSMLGALLALLVGGGAYVYLSGSQSGSGTAKTVPVVVAAADIPVRTRVEAAQLVVKQIPADLALPQAIRSVDAAVGRFVLAPVRVGEQVLAPDLGDAPNGSSLAQLIPAGKRAISFGVSDAIAAGGLIAPGDRIDVVGVFKDEKAAAMVASNVEVLAVSTALIGSESAPKSEKATPNTSVTQVSATVTVAADVDVAQRIAMADELGALRVAVRRPSDNTADTTGTTELKQLLGVLSVGLAGR